MRSPAQAIQAQWQIVPTPENNQRRSDVLTQRADIPNLAAICAGDVFDRISLAALFATHQAHRDWLQPGDLAHAHRDTAILPGSTRLAIRSGLGKPEAGSTLSKLTVGP